MRLNKKGYMLVEIIVSFALTFAIMISMINLVLSFKNKNEDIYYEAKYLKDKNLITRNIMDDLSNAVVTEIHCEDTKNDEGVIINQFCELRTIKDYIPTASSMEEKLIIKTYKEDNETVIEYTLFDKKRNEEGEVQRDPVTNAVLFEEIFFYKKSLEPSLTVGEMYYKDEKGVFNLTIPINSIYTDESYDINLVTKRVYSLDLNILVGSDNNYETYTEGYPTGVNSSEKIRMNVNINNQNITAVDIYRFLEYDTLVKFNSIIFPSSLDGKTFSINKEFKIESDTAINLYYDSPTNSYEKICLVEDTAGNKGECVDFHVNSNN